ncbi:MAG: hypothetical protein ACKOQR_13140 [Dolichospermum sp.]
MDSLKYWLGEISFQRVSQWQIAAAIRPFLSFEIINNDLKTQIQPLLMTLSEGGKSLRHKANIARFALDIVTKYQEYEDWKKSTENFF